MPKVQYQSLLSCIIFHHRKGATDMWGLSHHFNTPCCQQVCNDFLHKLIILECRILVLTGKWGRLGFEGNTEPDSIVCRINGEACSSSLQKLRFCCNLPFTLSVAVATSAVSCKDLRPSLIKCVRGLLTAFTLISSLSRGDKEGIT